MENRPKSDSQVLDEAMRAGVSAAAYVIQQHLGVNDSDYASRWWDAAEGGYPAVFGEQGLRMVLFDYMDAERRAAVDNDGVAGALSYAITMLRNYSGPIPAKHVPAAALLETILHKRGPNSSEKIRAIWAPGTCRLTELIEAALRE